VATERHLCKNGLELKETPKRHRLTKADRLLERAEFVHLMTKAPRISNRHFVVYFEAGKNQRSRIGITASRKVGSAVTRNRIKRLVREFFRKNRSMVTRPVDLHVIAKKETADGCSHTISHSLEMLFRRIESYENE
jgi:ribonuclease P protein component